MTTARDYIADLSDDQCRDIHHDYLDLEKTGITGSTCLRFHAEKLLETNPYRPFVFLMDDLIKEVWRRFALHHLE